jgi:hypothetical protein
MSLIAALKKPKNQSDLRLVDLSQNYRMTIGHGMMTLSNFSTGSSKNIGKSLYRTRD